MSSGPTAWEPDADVQLDPVDTSTTDEAVQGVAVKAAELQELVRSTIPTGPHHELALRYADLLVQAAQRAAQDGPPVPTGSQQG